MDMIQAVKSCFKQYVTTSGRACRSEYWYWVLFTVIASLILAVIDTVVFHMGDPGHGPLKSIFSLATFLPGFCVGVRRLHDVNRSGWWTLIALTIIGIIPLFYWSVIKGTTGDNHFGPDPLAPQIVH